jgi:hypothetical protein
LFCFPESRLGGSEVPRAFRPHVIYAWKDPRYGGLAFARLFYSSITFPGVISTKKYIWCAGVPTIGSELPTMRIQPLFIDVDIALPIEDEFDAAFRVIATASAIPDMIFSRRCSGPSSRHPPDRRRSA